MHERSAYEYQVVLEGLQYTLNRNEEEQSISSKDVEAIKVAKQAISRKIESEYYRMNSYRSQYINNSYLTDYEINNYLENAALDPVSGQISSTITNPTGGNRIAELMNKFNLAQSDDDKNQIKAQIIKLGWNPDFECNKTNIEKGITRIESMYDQEIKKCYFLDCVSMVEDINDFSILSENGPDYSIARPYYVVVKEPWHGYITTDLTRISEQLTEPTAEIKIYEFWAKDFNLMANEKLAKFNHDLHDLMSNYTYRESYDEKLIVARLVTEAMKCSSDMNAIPKAETAYPVVKKVYEGRIMDLDPLAIYTFDWKCYMNNPHGATFKHDSPEMPSVNYIAVNTILDQFLFIDRSAISND